ncbi:MAG TPA: hypothetical protein VJZ32_06780 [Candidatus Bathyarchaeia archaeon]|nr:hypothetical protein [Candidatus Bathyarchaeia archaeon]
MTWKIIPNLNQSPASNWVKAFQPNTAVRLTLQNRADVSYVSSKRPPFDSYGLSYRTASISLTLPGGVRAATKNDNSASANQHSRYGLAVTTLGLRQPTMFFGQGNRRAI